MLEDEINQAVKILRQGGLVAFPTETVYGLGADAKNSEAVRKVFIAKKRPMDHPLIVHIGDMAQLSEWANEVSPTAIRLAKAFWPGPLTLILRKAPHVSDLVTGGQDTVGIRIPNHPVVQALLHAFGSGLVGPSANRFGRISPTTAQAVREELDTAVDWVLDGGQCEVGVESTIVDVSGDHPVILRPGMITAKQIEAVLHGPVMMSKKGAPRVSGSLEFHYAPQTRTYLITQDKLEDFLDTLTDEDLPCALLARNPPSFRRKQVEIIQMPVTAQEYAHDLYQTLRELDKKKLKQIIIEAVPDDLEWNAIQDRLKRATLSFK